MRKIQELEFNLFRSILDKDDLTARHSLQVAHIFAGSISVLGLKLDSKHAYIAGLLHDVGKIYAPDIIFSEKSPLSHDEYEMVKKHPIDSCYILKAAGIPKDICEIALLHHERADGSGYPYGIINKEMMPEIKLIAIVDSFCALVEKRAYRKPVSIHAALDILLDSKDKYDRRLLKAFCSYIKSVYNDNTRIQLNWTQYVNSFIM